MSVALFTRKYLADYARNPINVVLLLVVPVIFVIATAGVLAEFAEILGSTTAAPALEANTAGWAAAFLIGIAAYFQVAGSRAADRRLAGAGAGALRITSARLLSAVGLAILASAGALLALEVRAGIEDVWRTVGATFMFASIYLAIGAVVGTVVRNQVNGAVLILFIWFLDVFLGPTMTGSDAFLTRLFPTHFVALVMVDVASGHASPLSDVGWALAWTAGSLVVATLVFASATRPPRERRVLTPGTVADRLAAGARFGFREYRRNIVFWLLLAVVPVVFISLSIAVTPEGPAAVELTEAGRTTVQTLSMIDVHGATMAPITIGFLAGLAGLFVVLDSAVGDRRIALAGFRSRELLASRTSVIAFVALFVTAISIGVSALDFTPESWLAFAGANALVALTYGMFGATIAPLVGRIGGLFFIFLIPFIDIGIAQNAMFEATPPTWAYFLPGYGAMRVLIDGAFTPGLDALGPLLIALGWLALLGAGALAVYRRVAEPERA